MNRHVNRIDQALDRQPHARPLGRPLCEPDPVFAPPAARRFGVRAAIAGAALVTIVGVAALAQSKGSSGKARVVERHGPELPIAANTGGQIVVLFPQASANGEAQGDDVEVVFVESNVPAAPAQGQPAPPPTATGREIVFSSRDANEGVVRYAMDAAGGERKVMILARVAGKYVEARQTGGGEGVNVYTVAKPEAPKPEAAKPDAPAADQPAPAEGQQPAAPEAPKPPAQSAVIVVYTGASGS